jgi:predicted nucleic acid-binding protein
MHKIMIAEAASRFGISRAGLVPWLQAHPERMAELGEFEQEVRELCAITMTCLPMDVGLLQSAAECSIRFRLLTNDAIIVGLMRRHDLTHLVTNDDDLDRVPGLTIWKPRTA